MTPIPRSRFALGAVALIAVVSPLAGQSVRVTVPEENFRKEPAATSANRLATVMEGAVLRVEDQRGRWIRGRLDGWLWGESAASTDRDGFDLVVDRAGGENLRAAPDAEAPRLARLMQGMLLDSLDSREGWIRVGRAAWIWAASTAPTEEEAEPPPVPADTVRSPVRLPDRVVVGVESAGLLVSPEGDTAAILRRGTDAEVLAREGGWTRVRLEGWVWEPATLPPDSLPTEGITVADLRANPEQFRGRRLEWRLRFVTLQRAEAIRTDFYEGEPYFLANPPARSRDLVYVAVPPELLEAVESVAPLQTIEVVARVRTGRSQTGIPILDLIALR